MSSNNAKNLLVVPLRAVQSIPQISLFTTCSFDSMWFLCFLAWFVIKISFKVHWPSGWGIMNPQNPWLATRASFWNWSNDELLQKDWEITQKGSCLKDELRVAYNCQKLSKGSCKSGRVQFFSIKWKFFLPKIINCWWSNEDFARWWN